LHHDFWFKLIKMKKYLVFLIVVSFFSCSDNVNFEELKDSIVYDYSAELSALEEINGAVRNDAEYPESILLYIDPTLIVDTKDNVKRFVEDLNHEEQNVFVELNTDLSYNLIKETIKSYYELQNIDGCIFIGDIPIPKAKFLSYSGNTYTGISTQYYMDLNGQFVFDDSDQIIDHSGERKIEIWVSVIPAYGPHPASLINSYFDKNHAFRTGEIQIEKGFINSLIGAQIEDVATYNYQLEYLEEEIYLDLNARGNLFFGIDNKLENPIDFPTASQSYENEILTNKYDVAKIGAHGNSYSFGSFNEWGSIIIDTEYAATNDVKPMLLIETSCNTAAIDRDVNLASEFLLNPSNNVLTYKGATSPQGGQGVTAFGLPANLIASNLTQGKCLGEALLSPMYKEYIGVFDKYREGFSAQQIVLGDGAIKLQEFLK